MSSTLAKRMNHFEFDHGRRIFRRSLVNHSISDATDAINTSNRTHFIAKKVLL